MIEKGQSPAMEAKQVVDHVYAKAYKKRYLTNTSPTVGDWENAIALIIEERNKADAKALEFEQYNCGLIEDISVLRNDIRVLKKEISSLKKGIVK